MTTQEKAAKMIEALADKGFTMEDLADLVRSMDNVKPKKEEEKSLKWRITEILKKLGVPQNILGYKYARYGIELACEDPEQIDGMTKTLYPAIAKKFGTTPTRAERAIRHAVEVAFENGSIDAIEEFFGNSFSPMKGKPTNSQFIASIADFIRTQDGK